MDIKPYLTNAYADLYLLKISETEKMQEHYFADHFPDRYAKAQRFKMPEDRKRCLAAGMLLYEKTGLEDADILTGQHGKPCAKAGQPQFSLSHSGDYALLAVGKAGEIGTDIEKIGGKTPGKSLIRRVCTGEEQRWLEADESPARENFYRIWTMKESVSKAIGLGLALPFDSFSALPLLEGRRLEVSGRVFAGESRITGAYAVAYAWITDAAD